VDGDGVGDNSDPSFVDSDGDGYVDELDLFPHNATEWSDLDGDDVGDNADAFPKDASETTDFDGDGVGDNADAFPLDPDEWADADGDLVGDNSDPSFVDNDGDGFPNEVDDFPNDADEWADYDGDGVGDNTDEFPVDSSESVDTDGDGVGDNADAFPSDPLETSDSDIDGVGDNADCDDADDTAWQTLDAFVDDDLDGVSLLPMTVLCTGDALPTGYIYPASVSTDCDDADDTAWQNMNGYADADLDGWSLLSVTELCTGASLPVGYIYPVSATADCNDDDAAINPGATEVTNNGIDEDCDPSNDLAAGCVDEDGDLYGYGLDCLGDDCDDSVATGAPCTDTCSVYYEDADADSYGNPGSTTDACSLPAGYLVDNTDCDDADENNWGSCLTCVDSDADASYVGCDAYISIAGPDCDDTLLTGAACTDTCSTFYYDGDGDAYGFTGPTSDACSVPAGYADNSTDCDDSDVSAWQDLDGYADSDLDDWSVSGMTLVCTGTTLPDGYVYPASATADCDDGNILINPGATEIPGNGIDEDCNPSNDGDGTPVETLYVAVDDTNCDDGDSGTESVPFCSIQAAIAAASADYTIYIAGGNYSGMIDIGISLKLYGGYNYTNWAAAPDYDLYQTWVTETTGSGRVARITGTNVELQGINLSADTSAPTDLDILYLYGADVTVTNSIIKSLLTVTGTSKGIAVDTGSNLVLSASQVINNTGATCYGIDATAAVTVSNSFINGGVSCTDVYNVYTRATSFLVNNTIAGFSATNGYAVFADATITLVNNIFDLSTGGYTAINLTTNGFATVYNNGIDSAGGDVTLSYDLVPEVTFNKVVQDLNNCAAWSGCLGAGGNIREVGGYVGGGDYHLDAGSLMIDVGIDPSAYLTVATDIDGDARPFGAEYDIGMDEYITP
jgi:Putative metal-binding motif